MNTNRNGIPVINKEKLFNNKNLDMKSDTIVMWKIVDGSRKEIEVDKSDPMIKFLLRDRWKYGNEY